MGKSLNKKLRKKENRWKKFKRKSNSRTDQRKFITNPEEQAIEENRKEVKENLKGLEEKRNENMCPEKEKFKM
jgi:gas vesicle protein